MTTLQSANSLTVASVQDNCGDFVDRIMVIIWDNITVIVYTVIGSKYYENEKRKDRQIEDRIARQKEELDSLTDQQKAETLAKVTAAC